MVATTVDGRPVLPRSRRDRVPAVRPSYRPAGPVGSRSCSGRSPAARRAPAARRSARRSAAARRSAVVGGFAAVLAACAVWVQAGAGRTGSGPLAAPGAGPTRAAAARVWVVEPGDTLWGIARAVQPKGDVRPLVDALDNEVHGRPLQVGEQLALP